MAALGKGSHMRKPFLRTVGVLTLLVSMALPLPASAVSGFGDVPIDAFYTSPVQWMVDQGITTGTSSTCFSPGDPVTRGQAAAFMWRMEGSPTGSAAHGFSDVLAPWQQEPVSWMAASGITTGTSETTFSPDLPVTRGEVAAFLHRLAGSPEAPPPSQFTDVVASWQITPVGWMVNVGITTGTSSSTFSPEQHVTRGQIATFLYRYSGSPAVTVDRTHPISPPCADQVPPPPLTPDELRAQFLAEKQSAGWLLHTDSSQGWSIMYPPGWQVIEASAGAFVVATPDDDGLFLAFAGLDAASTDNGSLDYVRGNVEFAIAMGMLKEPDWQADQISLDVDFDGIQELQDVYGYDLEFAADPATGDPIPEGFIAPTRWYGYYAPDAVPAYGYIFETLGAGSVILGTADEIVKTFTPNGGYP